MIILVDNQQRSIYSLKTARDFLTKMTHHHAYKCMTNKFGISISFLNSKYGGVDDMPDFIVSWSFSFLVLNPWTHIWNSLDQLQFYFQVLKLEAESSSNCICARNGWGSHYLAAYSHVTDKNFKTSWPRKIVYRRSEEVWWRTIDDSDHPPTYRGRRKNLLSRARQKWFNFNKVEHA